MNNKLKYPLLSLVYIFFILFSLACGYSSYQIGPFSSGPTFGDVLKTFVLALLLGLVPATIAHSKGKDFVLWWVFGTALFIVALPAALLALDETSTEVSLSPNKAKSPPKVCPKCGVINLINSTQCEACGTSFQDLQSLDNIPGYVESSIKCPRCGFENPQSAITCEKCMRLLNIK